MSVNITITTAGRAALVNAANTGTDPVTVTQVGISATAVTPSVGTTALAGEFKRLSGVSGDVVAADTIHINTTDESSDAYTMRSFALYLADGTLFGLYGQADPLIVKTAASIPAIAFDVIFADISAALLTFGNTNFLNPPATTERQGVVELATVAEAQAGIDALRALTPASAKAAVLGWLLAQDGSGSGLDADLLDGQHGSYYADIAARLGFTPWGPSNDGSGSGLDADLLDGQHGAYYADILARLGYAPVNKGGDTVSGALNVIADLSVYNAGGAAGVIYLNAAKTRFLYSDGTFYYLNGQPLVVNGGLAWTSVNDGSGSGLDADLLNGQYASFYADIAARLGYTPVQQGTGIGQLPNVVKIGWSGTRLKATVDSVDQGGLVFENYITDIWRASNDGSGSGLDADLLDGYHASDFLRSVDTGTFGSNANGNWEKRPNGVIEQWGSALLPYSGGSSTTGTVTFPIPFPNACEGIVGNGDGRSNSGWAPLVIMPLHDQASPTNKTNCTYIADSTNSGQAIQSGRKYLWRAIGR